MSALELAGVEFRYGPDLVLRGITLSVDAGETVALLGPNGAGKTTLTKLTMALLHPSRGDVRVGGISTAGQVPEDVAGRAAYVFQHADQQLFATSVKEEVEFGPRQLGKTTAEINSYVEAALEAVGLEGRAGTHPYDLPPAERKLVALAAALAQQPKLLVLDEPTQGLDRSGKNRVITALRAFAAQGGAVIAVTHDLGFVAEALERAVVMEQGTIVADEPARVRVAASNAVTARVSVALRLPGTPVKVAEVVQGIRTLSGA